MEWRRRTYFPATPSPVALGATQEDFRPPQNTSSRGPVCAWMLRYSGGTSRDWARAFNRATAAWSSWLLSTTAKPADWLTARTTRRSAGSLLYRWPILVRLRKAPYICWQNQTHHRVTAQRFETVRSIRWTWRSLITTEPQRVLTTTQRRVLTTTLRRVLTTM